MQDSWHLACRTLRQQRRIKSRALRLADKVKLQERPGRQRTHPSGTQRECGLIRHSELTRCFHRADTELTQS